MSFKGKGWLSWILKPRWPASKSPLLSIRNLAEGTRVQGNGKLNAAEKSTWALATSESSVWFKAGLRDGMLTPWLYDFRQLGVGGGGPHPQKASTSGKRLG
uniref:Uncharacterized protein n=1 Tax=Sphaerodactylus townsendi TaxID=933632 RepID=A0ACB8FKA1_9SAUR